MNQRLNTAQISEMRGHGRRDGFHARLRAQTQSGHDKVDALFGAFDLTDPADYGRFLTAHAKALVPLEDWAWFSRLMPGWVGRKEMLYADLARLKLPLPHFEPLDWPRDEATRWGAAYVMEGSRLGGIMLSRTVPDTLPCAYLGAAHVQGGWQSVLREIEAQAEAGGEAWQERAIASAIRTFDLYARAAGSMTRG